MLEVAVREVHTVGQVEASAAPVAGAMDNLDALVLGLQDQLIPAVAVVDIKVEVQTLQDTMVAQE
jgi:hypothetical protein